MSSTSVVPRGFSKYYVLYLLKEKALTGKGIMDETSSRTNGNWHPSPGLVYPLLGRLLSAGLIEEAEGGGYGITPKGDEALTHYQQTSGGFDNLMKPFLQLGISGAILAQDAADRLISLAGTVRDEISKLGSKQSAKYRKFLMSELNRLDREDTKHKAA